MPKNKSKDPLPRNNMFHIKEEDIGEAGDYFGFKLIIYGKGKKKYKQLKRMLNLLNMKWFD